MKVHKMQNRSAELLGEETHKEILTMLASEMQSGYRLTFPIFSINEVTTLLSVALLARANDPRVRRIKGLAMPPQADHLFLFVAFTNEDEWLKYTKNLLRLFPEQPQSDDYSNTSRN